MVDMRALLDLQGQLFLLALLGVLFRRRLTGADFQQDLSTLVMDLILPCNIITSFQTALTGDLVSRSIHVLIVSLAGQTFAFLLATVLYRRAAPDRACVMRFATLCSNAAFLGIPVVEGIWHGEGVLLATIFLLPQRFFMWSVGLGFFTSGSGRGMWKRLLTNHCIIAMMIGLVLMFTQWQLPVPVQATITCLSRCTTGMSMFLVGMIISQIRRSDFLDGAVLWLTVLRLVLMPGVIWLGCRLFRIEATAASVSVLLTAMPAGATTALLAARYGRAEGFAASVVTVSTLLSLLTIPLWGWIMS
ncbi:MAG: AEC family transporter [Oscillospiraceae bacterium]|nr:AEC family transporter [Oscillospiraceae bacterium]